MGELRNHDFSDQQRSIKLLFLSTHLFSARDLPETNREGQVIFVKSVIILRSYSVPIFLGSLSQFEVLGPVVRRLISANPGFTVNRGLFFFRSKAFFRKIFSNLFIASSHQIEDKRVKN